MADGTDGAAIFSLGVGGRSNESRDAGNPEALAEGGAGAGGPAGRRRRVGACWALLRPDCGLRSQRARRAAGCRPLAWRQRGRAARERAGGRGRRARHAGPPRRPKHTQAGAPAPGSIARAAGWGRAILRVRAARGAWWWRGGCVERRGSRHHDRRSSWEIWGAAPKGKMRQTRAREGGRESRSGDAFRRTGNVIFLLS